MLIITLVNPKTPDFSTTTTTTTTKTQFFLKIKIKKMLIKEDPGGQWIATPSMEEQGAGRGLGGVGTFYT